MLVSKIKPCKSKYKQLYCETADGSLYQLSSKGWVWITIWITVVILELIHAKMLCSPRGRVVLLAEKPTWFRPAVGDSY